jgi:hypothetical protein
MKKDWSGFDLVEPVCGEQQAQLLLEETESY